MTLTQKQLERIAHHLARAVAGYRGDAESAGAMGASAAVLQRCEADEAEARELIELCDQLALGM